MFHLKVVSLRFFILVCVALLFACSSGSDEDNDNKQLFTITLESSSFELETNSSKSISYQLSQAEDFSINAEVTGELFGHEVSIDTASQTITFSAKTSPASGTFIVRFSSDSHSVNQSISYTVNEATNNEPEPDDGDNTDSDNSCNNDPSLCPEPIQDYIIFLPTDYITIFEEETVTIDLQRNYDMDESIEESFYFNAHHIEGRLSENKQQLILKAVEGEEDTYGEIVAVTKKDGIEYKSAMQLIYFNKNRDLQTDEAPVIALLQPEIMLDSDRSSTINFDVYDPDSDRISYRVLKSPKWVESHINKAQAGFDLTFYPLADFDADDNQFTLEVSDAHNTDQFTFILSQQDNANAKSAKTVQSNTRPELFIEENVNLSLIKKINGDETGLITQLAFAYEDKENDHVDLSVSSSSSSLSFKLEYPFIYVQSDDVSNLQHEQITVKASDGKFDSKLTFHLYIKNNFITFLGGNPNLAPLIAVTHPVTVLETKALTIPFELSDFEKHDFDTQISFDDQILHAILNDNHIAVSALPIAGEQDINTQITLTATDVFGSAREQIIDVVINKNTPPDITFDINEIRLVEGFTIDFGVTANDINEGELTPSFEFDINKLDVEYQNGELTLTALDIVEDYQGEFTAMATDEFGATTTSSLPVTITFTNTEPVITAEQTELNILPGESVDIQLSYVDPEADEMSINRVVDSGNLDFSYDAASATLTLTVDENANYEDVYHFTTTASDGFLSSELIITVTVPDEPVPPVLVVEPYFTNVNEESTFIINFAATDDNGDDINISISGSGLDDLQLTLMDSNDPDDDFDHVEIVVPDNVLTDTNYSFNLVAVDNSSNIFTDIETISFTVMPVNDVPQITLSNDNITLINDDQLSLPISITDPDNTSHTVEVRSPNSAIVPADIVVHAADNNSIIISGAAKGTIVNNLPLVVRVYDSEAFADVPLTVSVELDNRPPTFDDRVDLIQMPDNSTQTFNITPTDPDAATDGDIVTVVSVVSDDPAVLEIVGDPNNPPLDTVTINTLDVSELTTVFITIIATDGYEQSIKRVQVDITNG